MNPASARRRVKHSCASCGSFPVSVIVLSIHWTLVLVLHIIFDGSDGELARLKFLESESGRKLDFFLDNVVNTTAIFAAGAGYYFLHGELLYLYLSLFSATISAAVVWPVYVLFFREPSKPASAKKTGPKDLYSTVEESQGRDFVYLILALAVIGKTHWFVFMTTVGLPVFMVINLYLLAKRMPEEQRAVSA